MIILSDAGKVKPAEWEDIITADIGKTDGCAQAAALADKF